MGSVFRRGKRWYIQWRDVTGRRIQRPTAARTKTEARRLVEDLERKAERQRAGLEPIDRTPENWSFGDLLRWWLDTYSAQLAAHSTNLGAVGRGYLDHPIAKLPLRQVTTAALEEHLQAQSKRVAPATVNHLRRFAHRAFEKARDQGKWIGTNPAAAVRRRPVPKGMGDYLEPHEAHAVLEALDPRWRPLFATAIYTGMRLGELCGLHWRDVDLEHRMIFVRYSWSRDTTKGKKALSVPIHEDLVPYLEDLPRKGPWVFGVDGKMRQRGSFKPESILRRAMARAGIADGWIHVCRRKGCGFREARDHRRVEPCPTCGFKLWPKPIYRKTRFHDLRHTTASLLLMSGAPIHAVSRILRHSDVRITLDVYGHLADRYLRDEINRLKLSPRAAMALQPGSDAPSLRLVGDDEKA